MALEIGKDQPNHVKEGDTISGHRQVQYQGREPFRISSPQHCCSSTFPVSFARVPKTIFARMHKQVVQLFCQRPGNVKTKERVRLRDIFCATFLSILEKHSRDKKRSDLLSRSSGCIGHQSNPQTGAPEFMMYALLSGKYSARIKVHTNIRRMDEKTDTLKSCQKFSFLVAVEILWDQNNTA